MHTSFEIAHEERAPLHWLYIAILISETAILTALAIGFWPRPPLGYELGWAGAGSMVLMQVYSLRRRLGVLRAFGSLTAWLDLHVFLGLQGFVFVAYHCVRVSTNASLASLNFALVVVIVIAGLVGRYVYRLVARARGTAGRQLVERCLSRWPLLHRPLAILVLAITTLHVLAHFAYAA